MTLEGDIFDSNLFGLGQDTPEGTPESTPDTPEEGAPVDPAIEKSAFDTGVVGRPKGGGGSPTWLPWALLGGGVVVAGAIVWASTRRKTVAANRRRRRRPRRRRRTSR